MAWEPTQPIPATPGRGAGDAAAPPQAQWGEPLARAQPRFGAGTSLSRTFALWRANAVRFGALALMVHLPLAALTQAAGFATSPPVPPERIGGMIGAVLLITAAFSLLWSIQLGATVHGVLAALRGRPAGVRELLATGLRRMGAVLAAGFLVWLGTMAGFLLLIVPALWVGAMWAVALPAAVAEPGGPAGKLRRSAALTRGRRWAVLGGFLALIGMVWAGSAAVQGVATVVGVATGGPARGALAGLIAGVITGAVFGPLPIVWMAVAYHDLRADKEGPDPAQLAAVFD